MPMFIPKRVAYLSSSIAHYERWFLMRADFVAPPFASEPRPHLTKRCSEPQAAVMTSAQHVYEVRPRKDHRGVDLISRCASAAGTNALNFSGFSCLTVRLRWD